MTDQISEVTVKSNQNTIEANESGHYTQLNERKGRGESLMDTDGNDIISGSPPSHQQGLGISSSSATSQTLEQHFNINANEDENEESFDEDDPLNVKRLAYHFDTLISKINDRTEELASQVYKHVEAKKYNNDINIEIINNKLKEMRSIIDESNDLNMEIDKLNQLRLITNEFKSRLKSIETTLKKKGK